MRIRSFTIAGGLALAFLLVAATGSNIYAQGRGGGRPASPGPPAGSPGVDRGLGNASSRSDGRSDTGLGTASTNSNGRSDTGLGRARAGNGNGSIPSDTDLNKFRGISKKLGTTPEALRTQYQAALAANPNLTFGQFVAANVIADNLNATHSTITAASILTGLQNGDSIGETLQNLGLASDQAKAAKKDADRQIKDSKKKN
jgi:hypothetical protein